MPVVYKKMIFFKSYSKPVLKGNGPLINSGGQPPPKRQHDHYPYQRAYQECERGDFFIGKQSCRDNGEYVHNNDHQLDLSLTYKMIAKRLEHLGLFIHNGSLHGMKIKKKSLNFRLLSCCGNLNLLALLIPFSGT
jgi:hypothetical protein